MSNVHTAEYQRFLKRLRQARIEAGLTQAQVAKLLRKRQTHVSKCELGERRVDGVELQRFATIYKKPLDFFLAGQ
jgi:transcriptional regulator with XRE-family HTH domain